MLEPHGAVGWAGLNAFLEGHGGEYGSDPLCVSLETAHPAKFPEEITRLLGFDPDLPDSLKGLDGKPEYCSSINRDYQDFKKYLLTEC